MILNLAKSTGGLFLPLIPGMWLSTLILTPVGAFLTYKAMKDSQLFNKEAYFRLFKKVRTLIKS